MGKISGQEALDALDKWDAYIDEYEDGLAVKKIQMEAILNSPTATQTEKDNARKTYEIQKAHLDELQFKRSQLQIQFNNDGEIDDTITFGVNGKMAMFVYQTEVGGQKYTGYARNAWPPNVFVSSEHFNLYFETTGSWGLNSNIGTTILKFGLQSLGWGTKTYNMKDLNHFSPDTGQVIVYGGSGDFFGITVRVDSNADDVIREGTQLYAHMFMSGILVELPNDTVPTETPWDYYNDDLLPNLDDPNIEIFPDGYEIIPEDQPPNEPEDIPHDDGTTLPNQTDRTLVAANRFITQYVLDAGKLNKFGETLWTSWNTPSSANNLVKNFMYDMTTLYNTGTFDISRVFEYIISLKAFPFDLTSLTQDYLGANDGIYMGTGYTNLCPGYESIPYLTTIIGALYAGTCKIVPEQPYQDFRDIYNTTVSVFLPYCGMVELTPAEVMNRDISVWYYIDFQSGGCTAVVVLDGDAGEYNIAAKSGQIGFTLPITATNAGQIASTLVGDATAGISTVSNTVFSIIGKSMGMAQSAAMAGIGGGSNSQASQIRQQKAQIRNEYAQQEGVAGIIQSGFNGIIGLANGFNDMLSRSAVDIPFLSGGSGSESMMFAEKPYVQIRRGKYCKPDNYPHSVGHINGSSGTIESFKGKFAGTPDTGSSTDKGLCFFTGVDSSGLTCHNDERAEIIALLESGVYL